jgi:hypothetical protein
LLLYLVLCRSVPVHTRCKTRKLKSAPYVGDGLAHGQIHHIGFKSFINLSTSCIWHLFLNHEVPAGVAAMHILYWEIGGKGRNSPNNPLWHKRNSLSGLKKEEFHTTRSPFQSRARDSPNRRLNQNEELAMQGPFCILNRNR